VFGCSRPTQRSAGSGVSGTHCKHHVEWLRRHGISWRGSLTVAEIEPYRKAARAWCRNHQADAQVTRVVTALDGLMGSAGRVENAYSLRGLSAERRAQIALARLRVAGVSGMKLLEITLTVKATVADNGPHGNWEFILVQIAKMAHRLSSGTNLSNRLITMRPKYPRSEGTVLRILGRMIEDLAGIIATPEAVDEVVAMVRARHQTGAACAVRSREVPKGRPGI
jgi:hypothetical protein